MRKKHVPSAVAFLQLIQAQNVVSHAPHEGSLLHVGHLIAQPGDPPILLLTQGRILVLLEHTCAHTMRIRQCRLASAWELHKSLHVQPQ